MTGQLQSSMDLPQDQPSFMAALMKLVVYNQLGLPEGIYRPDLLPEAPGSKEQEQELSQKSLSGDSREAVQDVKVASDDQEQGEIPAGLESTKDIDFPKSSENPTHPISDLSPNSDNLPVPVPVPVSYTQLALNEHPEVKAAYVPLCYTEGFPTLNGVPFWIQLNFEPAVAYKCFDLYLSQGRDGARQIYILQEHKEFPENVSTQDLHDYAEMFFWASRTKSFDMFSAAHRRKERERRAISTENEHYLLAERLMSIADTYLTENGDELAEMMTPKMLLEFIKTSTQLQRISAGLPANGPSNMQQIADGPRGESTSLEIIMRTIAKETGAHQPAEIVDTGKENRSKLNEILKDEHAIELAQELIIKVNQPKEVELSMETS